MISGTAFPLVAAAAAFSAGAALSWYFERIRGAAGRDAQARELKIVQNLLSEARSGLDRERSQLDRAVAEAGQLRAEIARQEERNASAQRELGDLRAGLPNTFKSLASDVLQEKAQLFADQNRVDLGQVLGPLRDQIKDFQKDFQEKLQSASVQQARDRSELGEQVKALLKANQTITEEANNLARALKGSSKTQGNWGEMILERILEASGLTAGREYFSQESYTGENGRRFQPDVVVRLPGGRELVIDSKVSLVDYERSVNAADEADRSAALTRHMASVRGHIKELAEKNYQSLYGLNTLDFVILFVPIEPAFMLAISQDEKLWEEAWRRNLLLVSQSTLLFVLRTVAYLWRQERQKENAEEIASRGAALYNKLVGFVEDLEKVGVSLDRAKASYDEALKKLSKGSGSAIRQEEMLRGLGVKPQKQLPADLVAASEESSDEPAPE